jgi:hypothetical protein
LCNKQFSKLVCIMNQLSHSFIFCSFPTHFRKLLFGVIFQATNNPTRPHACAMSSRIVFLIFSQPS